jgi:hypothetical protein
MSHDRERKSHHDPSAALVPQGDLYTLLVGAVRYALGRRSYIVGSTDRLVRQYARELGPAQRDTLLADLRRHVTESPAYDEGPLAEPADIRAVWSNLLDDFEAGRV